jgi:DNA polymerase-3 subunit delta'
MIIHSWLKKKYKKIIFQYLNNKLHHSIIISSQIKLGSHELIFLLCKRILCVKSKNFFSCNKCHNCLLIEAKNYPDLHVIRSEKNKKMIGIDCFLNSINKAYCTSKLGKKTIIWIPKIHLLTESSINSFLKILEEPPLDTLFFLDYKNSFTLKKTLRSRCIIYNIYPPTEKEGIIWLKKTVNNFSTQDLLIALKLSENSPILAKKILNSPLWIERKKFFQELRISIKQKNLFYLLNNFKKNAIKKIFWVYSLIIDVIKFCFNKNLVLINTDQNKLIKIIKEKNKIQDLYIIINSWKKCFFCMKNISQVNQEFILLEPLIIWEKIFNF